MVISTLGSAAIYTVITLPASTMVPASLTAGNHTPSHKGAIIDDHKAAGNQSCFLYPLNCVILRNAYDIRHLHHLWTAADHQIDGAALFDDLSGRPLCVNLLSSILLAAAV